MAATFDPLGTGITLPFRRVGGDFAFASGVELVSSDLQAGLLTRGPVGRLPGELPWRGGQGSRLDLLKFVGEGPILAALAQLYAGEVLARDARVTVVGIEVSQPPGEAGRNRLDVLARYRLSATTRSGTVADDVVRTSVQVG